MRTISAKKDEAPKNSFFTYQNSDSGRGLTTASQGKKKPPRTKKRKKDQIIAAYAAELQQAIRTAVWSAFNSLEIQESIRQAMTEGIVTYLENVRKERT